LIEGSIENLLKKGGSKMATRNTYESIASQLDNWLQTAVFDMAGGDEAAAEDMYNDPDALSDIMGDRIHDEGHGDYRKMIAIAEHLMSGAHLALARTCAGFIKRWSKLEDDQRLKAVIFPDMEDK